MIVDTSLTGIGWVINQEDENGTRFPIRFGAKVLSERQRGYAQVKRELWDIFPAVKADKDYLIGTEVIIETNFLMSTTILQCSLRSIYTNSQNIFPTEYLPYRPPGFCTEPAFLRTGLRLGTRPRPHRSFPTDPILGLLNRCGRC